MQGRSLPKHNSADRAVSPSALPIESKGLRKPPQIEPEMTVEIDNESVPMSIQVEEEEQEEGQEEEEEIYYQPSKFDKVSQQMLDELRNAFNLDPTGEAYTVVVAVTTSNGKIFNIKADSTEDQRFKDMEIWGKAFVEAEVTKTMTAFSKSEEARQRGKLVTKKSPI